MIGILSFLAVASGIAFVTAIVWLLIRVIKKKQKKPCAIMATVSVVLFIVSFVAVGMMYEPTPEQIAERERVAAEKAELKKAEAEKIEQEKAAAEKAEQEKMAAEKAEQEKMAAEKAEQEKAEREKAAAEKAEQEKAAAEKIEQEKAAAADLSTPAESEDIESSKEYTLLHGQLESVIENGSTVVVKAKIEPNLTNRLTINQNYYNICDLIENQGLDSYDEVQYWAIADMASGDEAKVISFDISKATIDGISSGTVLPLFLGDYVDNLWIHPSLQ